MGSLSGRLFCFLGMLYSWGHNLVSVKTEHKQCCSLHWILTNGHSQTITKENNEEIIAIQRTLSICITGYACSDCHSRYSRYQPAL